MTDDLDNFPLDAIFSKTGTSNHVFFNVILKKKMVAVNIASLVKIFMFAKRIYFILKALLWR